ncbi:hypothetical protein MKX54_03915 [Alkalihalobacillus sp. FSL R5-0424]
MTDHASSLNRMKWIKYSALLIGIVCFFLTFVPFTRVVMIGSSIGDYIIFVLTPVGVVLSIIALVGSSKKFIPIVALVLSLSFPLFFVLVFILLITGVTDFAP